MNNKKRFAIKAVAQRTGLNVHTIRVWEKRYQVVSPLRTGTNRRLYSEQDIELLRLLYLATQNGHSISSIADLSIEELRKLIEPGKITQYQSDSFDEQISNHDYLDICTNFLIEFDQDGLEKGLLQASLHLSLPDLFNNLIIPLLNKIGELWKNGKIRIAQEHLATAVLKPFLSNLRNSYRPAENAPVVIVTTPIGQLHELGALMVALLAAAEGWRVVYLGPNLPAEEIAAACIKKNGLAVLLSLVYPVNDPSLTIEMEKLVKLVPPTTKIIVGGRVSQHYHQIFKDLGIIVLDEIQEIRQKLVQIENNRTESV